jgi:two-component system, LuxR family, sensor kinase FixL
MNQDRESYQSLTDALFESTTEGIIITNRDGEIIMINPSAERMFRYKHNELVGKKVEILVPKRVVGKHVGYRDEFNAHPKARSMGMGLDLYAVRSDNTEFPVEISLSYFKRNDENYVISFIIDITHRKKAEDEILDAKAHLENYAEQLKLSNRELEQFAYVASHDLQEPLRKIQAFGDRIKNRESEGLTDTTKDYLDRMLNAASRMQNLINALLTFSRVSSQAKPFKKIDLNQVLKEILTDLEIAIESSGAKLTIGELPSIEADPTQMWQLFQNLISNALKFQKPGSKAEISVQSENINCPGEGKRNCVKITISDNGIGFDEKYTDRIFNIFQRLESANYKGTGVGLAICKKIVHRHGGEITAKSTPGDGSKFIITLPVKQSDFLQQKTEHV